MTQQNQPKIRNVLIVSSHPLFGEGIRKMLETHHGRDVRVVGIVSNVDEAVEAFETLNPDLVVVDYDDEKVNREAFLARFVEGESQMRVVLFSLKEGGSNAIVYDRRTMEASDVTDWLDRWERQQDTEENLQLSDENQLNLTNKKVKNRGGSMKHVIGAVLFVAVLAVISLFVLRSDILLPVQASVQAEQIDWLFDIQFKIIAFLFALIVGVSVYSIIFFRRRKGDLEDGAYIEGNNALEITWTILPLMIVIGISYIGSGVLADTMRMDPRALEVKVVGTQWSWRFEYPDQGITTTDLVLPNNKQVLLRLTSDDVIHSFWVPEFRVKQDAIPGSFRELRITPNKLGEYQMVCAELCGEQHAYMVSPVRVVEQEEFDEWVVSSQIPDDPIARGENLFQTQGCASCHSLDGTQIVGPTFKGLYGRTEEFVDGTSTIADDDYIIESILDPYAQIVEGFEISPGSGTSVMPANYGERLTTEQIQDIIEYIKTLE